MRARVIARIQEFGWEEATNIVVNKTPEIEKLLRELLFHLKMERIDIDNCIDIRIELEK